MKVYEIRASNGSAISSEAVLLIKRGISKSLTEEELSKIFEEDVAALIEIFTHLPTGTYRLFFARSYEKDPSILKLLKSIEPLIS